MKPHGIVKGFDVLEHAQVSGFEISERFMLGPLMLEGPEEAFGDGGRGSRVPFGKSKTGQTRTPARPTTIHS